MDNIETIFTDNSSGSALASLAKKITMVVRDIEKVERGGWNDAQKYSYVDEDGFFLAVRNRLAKVGVAMFTSVESQETREYEREKWDKFQKANKKTYGFLTTVSTLHTFVDTETGATFSVGGCGMGADSLDKSIYKAITGATKYCISKNFLLATRDDPERDEYGEKPITGKKSPVEVKDAEEVEPAASTPKSWRDYPMDYFPKVKGKKLGELSDDQRQKLWDNWKDGWPKPMLAALRAWHTEKSKKKSVEPHEASDAAAEVNPDNVDLGPHTKPTAGAKQRASLLNAIWNDVSERGIDSDVFIAALRTKGYIKTFENISDATADTLTDIKANVSSIIESINATKS